MNLCLDARTATEHFPGIGRYTVNLARAMAPLLDEDERLILLHDPTSPSFWDLGALAGERVQVVEVSVSSFCLGQQWAIPCLLRRLRAGIYHSPYYLMPYWPSVPTVLTMYDLIPLLHPQCVSAQARLLFRWATALALRAASYVIVISQATHRDLLAFYRLSPQKVTAIPLAPNPGFHPQVPSEIERVRRRYALPGDYVLYLGINKPHKNLVRLVEAWHLMVQSSKQSDTQLVVAGAWDERYPEGKHRVEDLDLADRVRFLDSIPDRDLPALYSGATLFVFPSLYEGFGLPVLEAMACGAPVLCSDTSSLPEVVGEAAVMVDPLDVELLAETMGRVLEDEALRAQMRERGLEQAANFSWQEAARQTLEVYKSVADSG